MAKRLFFQLAAVSLIAATWPAMAARDKPLTWVTPVIQGHGQVHPRPDAAVQPDPKADYKLFVRIALDRLPAHPKNEFGELERLARLVNLMSIAGVPRDHVHIVALLDGGAMNVALNDAAYHEALGVSHNPNLPLLHALRESGVELLVCSQALAGSDLLDSAVSPDVTVTLSALTDMAVYGQRGYAFMQL